jgi:hypothetical protein
VTVTLAVLTVLANGLIAGLSLDRSFVALPAWRRLGVEAWAAFSRHADLGRGIVLYPVLGLGGPLLGIATAVAFIVESGPAAAVVPVLGSVALSFGHVLATTRAGPNMLRVRHSEDAALLERAFAGFERWHAVRAVLQVLAFGVSTWALVALLAA